MINFKSHTQFRHQHTARSMHAPIFANAAPFIQPSSRGRPAAFHRCSSAPARKQGTSASRARGETAAASLSPSRGPMWELNYTIQLPARAGSAVYSLQLGRGGGGEAGYIIYPQALRTGSRRVVAAPGFSLAAVNSMQFPIAAPRPASFHTAKHQSQRLRTRSETMHGENTAHCSY